MIAIAIFLLMLTGLVLPHDNSPWLFGAFAFLLALVGARQIDKAHR